MNDHKTFCVAVIGLSSFLLLGCAGAAADINPGLNTESSEEVSIKEETAKTPVPTPTPTPTPTPVPVCDGVNVTSGCQVDGVMYSKYIYHPAVPEQSHIETSTTTEQVVADYCTLCVDGSWSPTCATGRGACSHHGGVSQKNVPRYANQTHTTETKVIDSPAVDAYYETVTQ